MRCSQLHFGDMHHRNPTLSHCTASAGGCCLVDMLHLPVSQVISMQAILTQQGFGAWLPSYSNACDRALCSKFNDNSGNKQGVRVGIAAVRRWCSACDAVGQHQEQGSAVGRGSHSCQAFPCMVAR